MSMNTTAVGLAMEALKAVPGSIDDIVALDAAPACLPAEAAAFWHDRLFRWITASGSRPKDPPASGTVYLVSAHGRLKIGFTTKSATERVAGLQTGAAHQAVLVASMTGTLKDEKAIHAKFARHRVAGEWFSDVAEIREFFDRKSKVNS